VLVGTAPNILAVPSSLPVETFKQFVDYARAHPGQLNLRLDRATAARRTWRWNF